MSLLNTVADIFLHLDTHLGEVVAAYGGWTYLLLFVIVFCETGLVITPFLPGDSLLFAAGAFAGMGSLNPIYLLVSLSIAAIAGDAVNYAVGAYCGPKVLERKSRFLKREYIERTERFYEKYGGKTIIFARFVPIVRTFAPFLAGVGRMSYSRFGTYNAVGGILWVVLFIGGGFFFGNIEIVRKHFTLVILAIIALSILPALIETWKARREALQAPAA